MFDHDKKRRKVEKASFTSYIQRGVLKLEDIFITPTRNDMLHTLAGFFSFTKKCVCVFFYNFLSVCEIVKSVISLCCTRWQNYSSACATRGYLLLVSFCLLFAMCALPFMRTFHLSVLQLCSFSCRIYESFGVSYYFQSLSVVGRRMKMSGLQSQCATIDETFTTLRLMCNFHLPMRFQTVGMHLRRIWLLFCVWVGVCGGEQIKGNMFSNDTWR